MSMHLQREIAELKERLLSLCAMVEQNLALAVRALAERDADLARRVIAADDTVDRREVELEEEALKILALHQPVAIDLRTIVATIKINSDLERIGDLAVNIAERAEFLAFQDYRFREFDFDTMSRRALTMVRNSVDAFVRMDEALARSVCAADDSVDALNRQMYDVVKQAILAQTPEQANILVHLLSVSRHLERIADHATNIAEDVIYMISGEIARHRAEDYVHQRGETAAPAAGAAPEGSHGA